MKLRAQDRNTEYTEEFGSSSVRAFCVCIAVITASAFAHAQQAVSKETAPKVDVPKATAAPAAVQAYATLRPPVVPFHKQATLTVVVESPAGLDVKVPDVRDLIGDLKTAGTPEHSKEIVGKDRVRTTESYLLDPIKIHDYFIRPLEIAWGDGGHLAVAMPVFRVRDLTPEELAEAEKFDAELPGGPGVDTGARRPLWVWAAVAGGALALLIALAVWMRMRRKPEAAAVKMPWDIAKERLALLAARHLPQQGKHDAYYVDLSSILRYYIEARFALHAPERTTPEFLAETIGKDVFSPQQEVFLSRFLRLCDRVKFARFRPDLEEMSRSFEEVSAFVEETVPRPAETAPATEKAAA